MGGEGRFAAAIIGTPGETWRPARDQDVAARGPAYGIGLVSRLPVTRWLVTRLPSAPVRSPILIPGPQRKILWLRDEPRVLIAAVLETPDGPMTVANTHLSFVPGWNGGQLRRAARAVRSLPAPADPARRPEPARGAAARADRVDGAGLDPDVPDPEPRAQLDHVLAHGPGLPRRIGAGAREMALSDHRALIVDLGAGKPDGMTDQPVVR